MKTNPNRFWTIVILLGWAFDFLFWKKPIGINFAIYVTVCLVTGILLLRADGLRLARHSGPILLPIALLAAATFLRLEPMTVFLSLAMTLFLMGVLALTYVGGQWMRYSLLDYIFGYLRLFGSVIARPLGFAAEARPEQPSLSDKHRFSLWPVVRGVVIALPIIAIFASLLSSADLVFAKRLKDVIDLFKIDNLPEYIFRLVYILVLAYALAGVFLHAAQNADEKISEDKPLLPPFLGDTEAMIVLGSVTILFLAFVVIQFQYFFGGQSNISIEGYSFSEYARRGFGELVAVAFFSLLLLLGLGAITRRETENQRRVFSMLGAGLVVLVLVILVSAFQRLVLYEQAYGFSRLRTYTHVFMVWLSLLLIAVVLLELLRRERSIGLTMILTALGFILSLNALNVDAFIVKQNVQREIHRQAETPTNGSSGLDVNYFLGLSADAVPPLVSAFHSSSLPDSVREEIGAALTCMRLDRSDESDMPWQSFHLSRYRADRGLKDVQSKLEAYQIKQMDGPTRVETPGGEEFYCYQYFAD